jgi:hypothetical protein
MTPTEELREAVNIVRGFTRAIDAPQPITARPGLRLVYSRDRDVPAEVEEHGKTS